MFAPLPRPQPTVTPALRCLVFALVALLIADSALRTAPALPPVQSPAAPVAPDIGGLPLAFEPNAGQASPEARFVARGAGGELFFTPGALVLSLPAREGSTSVALRFDGARRGAAIVGDGVGEARVSYLRGSQPQAWLAGLHTYGAVIYRQLYSGVDLRFDGADGQLKGTYTVAPGADPSAIRWRYDGAASVSVDKATGDLRALLPGGGALSEKAPVAWQVVDGQRIDVPAAFGVGADGRVGFTLGRYDARHALTIDPTLTYSSYLGGNQGASARAVAVDADGFIYVAGHTRSTDFPLVRGVQPNNNGGSYDAFVSKFTRDGKTLVYSTYLGGGESDYANGIVVDGEGRATVAGWTGSTNFPLPAPPARSSTTSYYLTLNASGSVILGGALFTLEGASGQTLAEGIARDAAGNLYVAGWTSASVVAQTDAFLRKIAPGGGVAYTRRIGGTANDRANGVAVDGVGNPAIAGSTDSADFPLTAPAQGAPKLSGEAFVARFDTAGNPVFSTYLGGDDYDEALGVASDAAGNVFVTGTTSSANFSLKDAFQATSGGLSDAFVTAYTPAGALRYSSYLGGGSSERGRAIAARPDGGVVVVGKTDSANFPVFSPQQGSSGGNADAFIAQIKPDGSGFTFSTYFGGGDFDEAAAVAVDSSGAALVVGEALSGNLPLVNPYQNGKRSTNSDLGDAFIARYGEPAQPDPIPGNDTGAVPGQPAQSRTVGSIIVRANGFSGDPNWTATGTLFVGSAIIVEEGTISLSGGALSGSGLVSLRTGAQLTRLFRGSFSVNTASGAFTPGSISEWKLNNFAGFRIRGAPLAANVSLDALAGKLSARLTLELVIPGIGNRISKLTDVTLDSSGAVTGRLADVTFKLGPLALKIIGAELGTPGFKITQAELQLPLGLGGNSAGFNAQNVYITKDGQFDLSRNGSIEINFPNITVGGASGFTIEGPKAKLAVNGDEYVFTGKGTFGLPGVGKGKKSGGETCGVDVGFSVSNLPPPIRQASLSISGCFSIPIDTTGFFLSGVNGSVELDEGKVSVDLGITITGGPVIPNFGALISGSIAAHWDNSWKVGLSGAIKVLGMDALRASLEISQARGLYGRFDVYAVAGIVNGYAEFRAWQSSGSFHITGSAGVNVKVVKGAYVSECVDLGAFDGCIYFPPFDVDIGSARADFGEFRNTESGGTLYGFKGSLTILKQGPYSFFVNSRGEISFRGTGKYQLLQPPGGLLRAGPNAIGAIAQAFTVAPNTPSILGAMLVGSGAPTLELIAPDNTVYTASTPGISITNTPTQTLLGIPNPQPGNWLINAAGSVSGDEVRLFAYGAQPVATIAAPAVTANLDGSYTIGYAASSATPTSTVSLFVDTSPISRTGTPVAQGLPLSGSFTWTPGRIANGTYHIYAMVDDPLGAPAFAYAVTPVTISDATPPPVPTGVQLSTDATTTTVTWQHAAPPDIAGYRVYYTEPGGHTSVSDVTAGDELRYVLAGLYLNGDWQVAVSAYDLSGNESARSAAATTRVTVPVVDDRQTLYLPVVAR